MESFLLVALGGFLSALGGIVSPIAQDKLLRTREAEADLRRQQRELLIEVMKLAAELADLRLFIRAEMHTQEHPRLELIQQHSSKHYHLGGLIERIQDGEARELVRGFASNNNMLGVNVESNYTAVDLTDLQPDTSLAALNKRLGFLIREVYS